MSWPCIPLGDAVDFKGGGTPNRGTPEYWGGQIPWATVKDFNNGFSIEQTQEYITESGLKNSASNLIPAGTVIIPTRMALGKVAISKVDVAINQDLKAVFPKEKIDTSYLSWFFACSAKKIEGMGKGATVKGITLDTLRAMEIPLPPLPEQRRIAAILDKADALRQKRRQAIEKLDQLLQSVFLDMFGDPVTNPKGWHIEELGNVFNFATGKLDSNAAIDGGEYPFFTCSREVFAIDKYAFDTEALLLAGNNAAGEYWVKHFCGKFNAYQRTYVLTKRTEDFTYPYLRYALQQKLKELQRLSKGTNTKYLTLSILKPLAMLAPPISHQIRFEKIASEIDRQKCPMLSSQQRFDLMFSSLQQRAFNGTL